MTLDANREQVIKRARFIRRYTDWKEVFIDPDRTPKQQEEHKSLRAEFKRRKDEGENIVFRNGKILKLARKQQGAAPQSAQQNQNNEMPPTPTWNIPSQYSMLQPPQQQNRNDIIQGTDPNMYASNVYSPGDAVSPPTMATSEAPTNWHEPTKPG